MRGEGGYICSLFGCHKLFGMKTIVGMKACVVILIFTQHK